jgi:hypothetical protein
MRWTQKVHCITVKWICPSVLEKSRMADTSLSSRFILDAWRSEWPIPREDPG